MRAAAVAVLPQIGFEFDIDIVVAGELWGVGCKPPPKVQFQVLPKTSSRGKGRKSLSFSKLVAVGHDM